MTTKILMVCLGNICRSPLAEGVMKTLIQQKNLSAFVEVDSAGTSAYHIGRLPDERSMKAAMKRGFKLNHRGRQLIYDDFKHFDLILAMDESNVKSILNLAQTDEERAKVKLITEFDPRADRPKIVADPYWGELADFELVLEQLIYCCEGWLTMHFEQNELARIS